MALSPESEKLLAPLRAAVKVCVLESEKKQTSQKFTNFELLNLGARRCCETA